MLLAVGSESAWRGGGNGVEMKAKDLHCDNFFKDQLHGNKVQENVKYQQSLFSLKGYGWQCMGQQVINASNTSYNAFREDNLFLTLKRKDICK